jgi:predicted  nucleic acid-binding Zn-ribbon protein
MISFRLSPKEYETFENLCAAQGARSLSDLARSAMRNLSTTSNPADALRHEVGDLRNEIRSLCREIDRLCRALESQQENARQEKGGGGAA